MSFAKGLWTMSVPFPSTQSKHEILTSNLSVPKFRAELTLVEEMNRTSIQATPRQAIDFLISVFMDILF